MSERQVLREAIIEIYERIYGCYPCHLEKMADTPALRQYFDYLRGIAV